MAGHSAQSRVAYIGVKEGTPILADAEGGAGAGVDGAGGLMTVETGGGGDEIGDIEGEETLTIETTGIALRQHEGLADITLGIDVTEIGTGEESVVATGTQDEPTGVCTPVVERICVLGVGFIHGAALICGKVEEIEVGLMVPDAELPVVGEGVAKESTVVGGTGEGHRLMYCLGIDDSVYTVAVVARFGVEIDAAEIVADGVELMDALR